MKFIQRIVSELAKPLPGLEVQLQMMNTTLGRIRKEAQKHINDSAKKAAVFLLLYQKGNVWYTVFMQRPESPYPHSKQISFPGGQYEDADIELIQTALRETEEEFGIPRQEIQTLGRLSDLYIPVSNFWVQPFVGYLPREPLFKIDTNEVAALIEVPLLAFFSHSKRTIRDIDIHSGHTLKDMPCYVYDKKIIWGATSMILHEFLHILEGADLINLQH